MKMRSFPGMIWARRLAPAGLYSLTLTEPTDPQRMRNVSLGPSGDYPSRNFPPLPSLRCRINTPNSAATVKPAPAANVPAGPTTSQSAPAMTLAASMATPPKKIEHSECRAAKLGRRVVGNHRGPAVLA